MKPEKEGNFGIISIRPLEILLEKKGIKTSTFFSSIGEYRVYNERIGKGQRFSMRVIAIICKELGLQPKDVIEYTPKPSYMRKRVSQENISSNGLNFSKLFELIKQSGVSETEFLKRCKISPYLWKQIISGKFSTKHLAKLCYFLGVQVEDIISYVYSEDKEVK